MAIRKLNEPGSITRWNSRKPFPKQRYAARCTSEKIEKSSAENPMIVREWEILCPEPVNMGTEQFPDFLDVDGAQATQYRVLKVKKEGGKDGEWDEEKSNKSFASLKEELVAAGFDPEGEIDDENPPLLFKGKVFYVIAYGKEGKEYQSQTPEQRKAGMKRESIKDIHGKDVVNYQLNIQQILGVADDVSAEGRPW